MARTAAQRRPPARERGVALVMTLSVLAIMLVLVVAFATLSRTEVGSASNYRDYVASKYLAQGGLNRAMAEIAFAYASNSNTFNTGLGSVYSAVNTNGWTFSAVYAAGNAPALFATDIENVTTNSRTGQVYARRGADNLVDYVVLPNQFSNANYTAQWLGMRDTNGVLVGRVAYIVTAGGLNINAIGNLRASTLSGGMRENARNEGQSVAELNLPAALIAMNSGASGWDFDAATNDLAAILGARYVSGTPGNAGDDDGNNALFSSDGLDNNGDGQVDEPNEGLNEPQELLWRSDGTANTTIAPAGDDLMLTDLKQLHDGTMGNDAASRARFLNNFSTVRRWFTTQSTVPVPPTLIPLNDTGNFPANETGRSDLFSALTNRFSQINFPTNNPLAQAQAAANVVNYAWPAADVSGLSPRLFSCSIAGTNVLGVARVPHVNQVEFEVIARVTLSMPSTTNIQVQLYYQPKVELWYPYTNAFPLPSLTISNSASATGGGWTGWSVPNQALSLPASWGVCAFNAITSTARYVVGRPATAPILSGSRTFVITPAVGITAPLWISNLTFSVTEEYPAGQVIDYTASFRTNFALLFPSNVLAQVTNPGFAPRTVDYTNVISFALNDPRVKQWYVEYAGLHTNNVAKSSLGYANFPANLTSDTCNPNITTSGPIFRPDLGEDSDFTGQAGQGIGPATFWVKHRRAFSSIAELGRVHRGQPWRTIDFKGGGTDGNLLDYVTTASNMWGGASLTYAHGKVNINARTDALPVWAALFAGMPFYQTQTDGSKTLRGLFDYDGSARIQSSLTKSKEFGKIFGSRAGALTHLGALTAVADLSNLSSNHAAVFPSATYGMYTDEDREYLLSRMINLIGTSGQGNTFTIYAWGQSLRGPPVSGDTSKTIDVRRLAANTNRMVSAETLIVAMVRPEVQPDGKLSLKLIYYRYNPDLELNQGF